jgi:hypothetical protein
LVGTPEEENMIKNSKVLQDFEDELKRKEKLSYSEALQVFESLWEEAVALKVLPLKDPLEGIETVIALARILNRV